MAAFVGSTTYNQYTPRGISCIVVEATTQPRRFRMCSPAICNKCGKYTVSGCGMHVEQVLGRVPADQRCSCTKNPVRPASPFFGSWLPR